MLCKPPSYANYENEGGLHIICCQKKKGGLAFSAIARGFAMLDLDPCFWTAPLQHFILLKVGK